MGKHIQLLPMKEHSSRNIFHYWSWNTDPSGANIIGFLHYDNPLLHEVTDASLINASIEFVLLNERSDSPLSLFFYVFEQKKNMPNYYAKCKCM